MRKNNNVSIYDLQPFCDTANVLQGYQYWFDKLLAYCLNIFDYNGLPQSLPAREIESNLILTGHCVTFYDKGELVTCQTELYNYDKYYNPTDAVYAQPKMKSGNLSLNDKTVHIIYNCDLKNQVLGTNVDGSLYTFIARYARQLADVESTLAIRLVDIRTPNMPTCSNDATRNSVLNFFKKIALGQRTVVVDDKIVPKLNNIELNKNRSTDTLQDILLARDKILEQFYREIGVRFYQTKKAQVNKEEVNANNSMFLISIDDMLKQRQTDLIEFNKKYSLNVSVRLNPKWGDTIENEQTITN